MSRRTIKEPAKKGDNVTKALARKAVKNLKRKKGVLKMKRIILILGVAFAFLAIAPNGFAQELEWKLLSEVNLDSLTGVANDIDTVNVGLIHKNRYPEFIVHMMEVEEDINNGEGFVLRFQFKLGDAKVTNSVLDTLTSAATGGFIKFYDMKASPQGGTTYTYSLQSLASAANTDSISYSSYVLGVYAKK